MNKIFIYIILWLAIQLSYANSFSDDFNHKKQYTERVQDSVVCIENESIELSDPILFTNLILGSDELHGPIFNFPIDICDDIDGNIYILDLYDNRIIKFNDQGKVIFEIGRKGKGPGELYGPYSIGLFSDGSLLISETDNMRFQLFNENGEFEKMIKTNFTPRRFVISGKDEVYHNCIIPHQPNERYPLVIKYDSKLNKLLDIGEEDEYKHILETLTGNSVDFDVDSKGRLWVCFLNQNKIQVFEENLLIKEIKRKINFKLIPFILDLKKKNGVSFGASKCDKITYSISIGNKDNVYLLTNYYGKKELKMEKPFTRILEVFDSSGNQIKSIPILDIKPNHMVVGENNSIYMIDVESALVYRFDAIL